METWTASGNARYEVNSDYQDRLQEGGPIISSVSAKEGLVEIVELAEHPLYIGAQFHPEFLSKPNHPHPLLLGEAQSSPGKVKITTFKSGFGGTKDLQNELAAIFAGNSTTGCFA